MIVQIMRHGEAEAKSGLVRDDERHLTQAGTAQVRAVLDISKRLGSKVDTILSSPLVRAKETAEIARRELGVDKYNVDQVLESDRTAYEVFQRLSDFRHLSTILLVTHQPLVSRLVSSLLNWDESFFMMPAGAIASIQVDVHGENTRGKLLFLIPPPAGHSF